MLYTAVHFPGWLPKHRIDDLRKKNVHDLCLEDTAINEFSFCLKPLKLDQWFYALKVVVVVVVVLEARDGKYCYHAKEGK